MDELEQQNQQNYEIMKHDSKIKLKTNLSLPPFTEPDTEPFGDNQKIIFP